MKISVFGTGYVGLVTGVCLADFGLSVTCVDVVPKKIHMLSKGKSPIYEPGIEAYLERNLKNNRISFTLDQQAAIEEADVIFIAVGTPPMENGEADLTYVYQVAENVGRYMNGHKIVVDKSTVPIGTGQCVKAIIREQLDKRGADFSCDVVSNPEFLREGKALQDFTHPDRVVIGAESEKAVEMMRHVYRPLYLNETPFVITNIETAEMIKYACNAFLAAKITFINEIANLCEAVGADVQQVANAMGRDGRISPKFLHAGPGYGGSCFPKDTNALAKIGRQQGAPQTVVEAAIAANESQKERMIGKIDTAVGGLAGKTVGVLGLAFKPDTDDMRDAPSLTIVKGLIERGAKVQAYDPQSMEEAEGYFGKIKALTYMDDAYDVAEGAEAVVLITEWHEFRNMDLKQLKQKTRSPLLIDLRNIYTHEEAAAAGFRHICVGKPEGVA
jgi:UDPglucose 6-dehydrogenase